MDRFAEWCKLIPPQNITIGLDEHTGIIMDLDAGVCEIMGVSSVSLVRDCDLKIHPAGGKFQLREFGEWQMPNPLQAGISEQAWGMVLNAARVNDNAPPAEIIALAEERLAVRVAKNWKESDRLRDEISALGWTVQDGKTGYKLVKN
jgi:hypothetical protein